MAATFDEIGTVTADGTTTSIEVTGIDQSYDDLQVILEFYVVDSSNPYTTYVRVNGDTATSTYNSDTMIYEADGSYTYQEDYDSYSGWRMLNSPSNGGSGVPYYWGNIIIDMMQYTATRTKSFIARHCTENAWGNNGAMGAAGLGYRNTAAISSISLSASANIGSGSTITVYGIKNS
tara:strand:- start:198 stop:728 length:531 start_codon:yes stop_codon:yes gene_type:complete